MSNLIANDENKKSYSRFQSDTKKLNLAFYRYDHDNN